MNRILRISAAMAILALVNSPAFTAVDPALKEAWDRLPKAERWFQHGVREFQAGRSEAAAKDFEKCLQEVPRHAFARYYLANIAYIANDLPRALGDMNAAVEDLGFMESLNDYGLTQKAKTYDSYKRMMNEEWAAAINCRARAEIDSLSGELKDTEKKQELQLERQKAARIRQKAHYLYFRGNIHFRLERFDDAARDYEQAIVLDPQQANAYNNLAAIYYLAGNHAGALDYLDRAIRQGLEDNLNLTLQSLVFEALGRPTDGILREEIAAGPENDLAIVRFAVAFRPKDPLRPPLYENAYVVSCRSTRRAVLIDPGVEDPRIDEFVRARGLEVAAILYTHGHEDHVGAGPYYASLYRAPILVGADDAKGLATAPDRTLSDGETLAYDGFALKVLHVPGHTPGSVCFLAGDVLFSGDTLFKDGIGLVAAKDGGSAKTLQTEMVRRIKDKLLVLPDATRVCSGHGKTTTIGDERANNAFLKQ
jgi:glyoxylase-like metal-dependent hydrolase (beta-lactamase superfamily II)/Tfp pilus assembly protein PilF